MAENHLDSDNAEYLDIGVALRLDLLNKPARNIMSQAVNRRSKAACPAKEVLVERNRSLQTASTQKLQEKASKLVGETADPKIISDPSSLPYDPLTNYLSPRPRFLLYNPNRRLEIFHREKKLKHELGLDPITRGAQIMNAASNFSPPGECKLKLEAGDQNPDSKKRKEVSADEDEGEEEGPHLLKSVFSYAFVICLIVTALFHMPLGFPLSDSHASSQLQNFHRQLLKIHDPLPKPMANDFEMFLKLIQKISRIVSSLRGGLTCPCTPSLSPGNGLPFEEPLTGIGPDDSREWMWPASSQRGQIEDYDNGAGPYETGYYHKLRQRKTSHNVLFQLIAGKREALGTEEVRESWVNNASTPHEVDMFSPSYIADMVQNEFRNTVDGPFETVDRLKKREQRQAITVHTETEMTSDGDVTLEKQARVHALYGLVSEVAFPIHSCKTLPQNPDLASSNCSHESVSQVGRSAALSAVIKNESITQTGNLSDGIQPHLQLNQSGENVESAVISISNAAFFLILPVTIAAYMILTSRVCEQREASHSVDTSHLTHESPVKASDGSCDQKPDLVGKTGREPLLWACCDDGILNHRPTVKLLGEFKISELRGSSKRAALNLDAKSKGENENICTPWDNKSISGKLNCPQSKGSNTRRSFIAQEKIRQEKVRNKLICSLFVFASRWQSDVAIWQKDKEAPRITPVRRSSRLRDRGRSP